MPLNPKAAQCSATSKHSRQRCKNPAVRGYSVCRMHGARGGAPQGNLNALKHGNTTSTMRALRHCRKERRKSLNRTLSILEQARKYDLLCQKVLSSSERQVRRLLRDIGGLSGLHQLFHDLDREYRANKEQSQELDQCIQELTERQKEVWAKLGICISTPGKGQSTIWPER